MPRIAGTEPPPVKKIYEYLFRNPASRVPGNIPKHPTWRSPERFLGQDPGSSMRAYHGGKEAMANSFLGGFSEGAMDKNATSVGRIVGAIRGRAKSSTARGLANPNLSRLGLENSTRPMEETVRSVASGTLAPRSAEHAAGRKAVKMTQEHFPKEDFMKTMLRGYTGPLNQNPPKFGSFASGFSEELQKIALTPERIHRAMLRVSKSRPIGDIAQPQQDLLKFIARSGHDQHVDVWPRGLSSGGTHGIIRSILRDMPKKPGFKAIPSESRVIGDINALPKTSASLPSPATIEEGIPIAKTLSAKILGVLKRRPGLATMTAAAAGAGAGVGLAQSQDKKRDEEKRREEIRQLLMSRLQEGGYVQ